MKLRAYNAEADNLVRGLKPYKLDSAIDRLDEVAATSERLGKTMSIRVAEQYHLLRIKELELSADYQETLAREKDKERKEREALREQRKLEQEIAREKARLDKERQHYANALDALLVNRRPGSADDQGRHDPSTGPDGPSSGTERRQRAVQLRRARDVLLRRRGRHRVTNAPPTG